MALYQLNYYGDSPCDFDDYDHPNELQEAHNEVIKSAQEELMKLINHLYTDEKLSQFRLDNVVEELAGILNMDIQCFTPLKVKVK